MSSPKVKKWLPRSLGLTLLLVTAPTLAAPIDPTRPPESLRGPSAEVSGAAPLQLQAIVRGGQSHRALIDGMSLRVGEEQGGLRVLAIYPHSVLIERQGQRQLLRLAEPVLQPSR